MARAGQEFANGASGARYVIRQTGAETDGALAALEDHVGPGTDGPIPHVHPDQTERFIVRSGLLGLRVGGRDVVLAPGEELSVGPGIAHKLRNAGDDELHITVEMRPALRFAEFLETAAALTWDAQGGARRFSLLEGVLLMHEFGAEIRPAFPPLPVQRIAFPLLAALARVLGYRLPPTGGPKVASPLARMRE